MLIKGLKLPVSFVETIRKGTLQREIGCWTLRKETDAYGNHLETELGQIYDSEESIFRETNLLPKGFESDEYYGETSESENNLGFIRDITDFSKIICFGVSGDGAPFCFDYRDDLNNPSIIWWDDIYWRRIAPHFDSFLILFDLNNRE